MQYPITALVGRGPGLFGIAADLIAMPDNILGDQHVAHNLLQLTLKGAEDGCRDRRKREKHEAARARQEAEARKAADEAAAAAAAEAVAAEEAAEAKKLRQKEKKAMQKERQRLRSLCSNLGESCVLAACHMHAGLTEVCHNPKAGSATIGVSWPVLLLQLKQPTSCCLMWCLSGSLQDHYACWLL